MKKEYLRVFVLMLCLFLSVMTSACTITNETVDVWNENVSLPPENNEGFVNCSYWERSDGELRITAAAAGGSEPYTCSMSFKRSNSEKWKNITEDFSKKLTYSLPAENDADYEIAVTVMDSSGKLCGRLLTSSAQAHKTENYSEPESESIKAGSMIKINLAAGGGKKPYRYACYFKNSESSVWHSFGETFSTQTQAVFKPSKTSEYTVRCVVIDAEGQAAEKQFTVYVKE